MTTQVPICLNPSLILCTIMLELMLFLSACNQLNVKWYCTDTCATSRKYFFLVGPNLARLPESCLAARCTDPWRLLQR